jgi:hypothetical protein
LTLSDTKNIVAERISVSGVTVLPINFTYPVRFAAICLAASFSFRLIAGPSEDDLCIAAARKTLR